MGCLLSVASLVPHTVDAATILERDVSVIVNGEEVHRQERRLVAIEEGGDLTRFRTFAIPLNDTMKLLSCKAEVQDASGRVLHRIPMRRHERVESPGYDLHNSNRLDIIPFPPLSVSQQLLIAYEVREKPRYPSLRIFLRDASPTKRLTVTIEAPGKPLRYRLSGDPDLFEVSAKGDSLTLRAADLAAERVAPLAPEGDSLLQVAYGPGRSWEDVAAWYERLIAGVPRGDNAQTKLLSRLLKGVHKKREVVDAVARYVQQEVRYEAVEVGAGGYVPTAPAEVMARGWGDCKDKSMLMKDLLELAGVPSYLVLLNAGADVRLDPAFPTPDLFNHCIVGIPVDALETRADDPVSDGVLLVDPTQFRGGPWWLSSACRGDAALLVAGDQSRLLMVGDDPRHERREAQILGRLDEQGDLSATIIVKLFGGAAVPWLAIMARSSIDERDQELRKIAGIFLPGSVTHHATCRRLEGVIPAVELSLEVQAGAILKGSEKRRWIPIRMLDSFPDARILDDRGDPVLLDAGQDTTRWVLSLPPGSCPPVSYSQESDEPLGRVFMSVGMGPESQVIALREATIRSSYVAKDQFDELRKLSTQESRADRHRLRLRCPDGGS